VTPAAPIRLGGQEAIEPPTESQLAQAEEDVAGARRALTAAERGLAGARAAVTTAENDAAAAAGARTRLRARTGPVVPMAEVGFAPSLPAAVTAVASDVGFAAPASLITLTPEDLVVRVAGLVGADSGVVDQGSAAQLALPGGEVVAGRVTSVAAAAGAMGLDVEIAPGEPLDMALAGENIKVTFEEASTSGEVLGVPQGAISSDSAGALSVVVVDPAQADRGPVLRRVEVEIGVAGADLVEVSSIQAGELEEGMEVVIGG
jgi:hypothetical protein